MPPESATITVDTTVSAPADTIYRLLTDLPTLAELGEEVVDMRWAKGETAAVGNVFRGRNRNGWHRWTTTCTVTDADGATFAFDVSYFGFPIARWRYDVTPDDNGGCRVTERMWDRRLEPFKATAHLFTGVRDRVAANDGHMRTTLARLKTRAETV
ncbi:SRPBCC family protein [Gordonia crocea]|uniref:Polyketide cyclase n=1 Tax=Gordonia crocea TaxID=589162 RepID=A0A7I9V0F4_9ACTN|nr:SRPBCC family protein [Gordonia crocea]GED98908.1 hypothetical protein nbrc107697_29470 [Gordonia crocea]